MGAVFFEIADGKDGTDGKDGVYYYPNPETGCFDIYNADGTFKEEATTSTLLNPAVYAD